MAIRGRAPLTRIEEAAVLDAIRAAENGNRGEVRVHLEKRCPDGDPLKRARAIFALLGMPATRDDTGVLLYVALADRKVAVFAGNGVHGAAAPGFWKDVADVVARGFAAGRGGDGLVDALVRIGDLLRTHAAGDDKAGNELPDAVTTS